jgi:hypothetical protein
MRTESDTAEARVIVLLSPHASLLLLGWFILNGPKRAVLPIPSANRKEVINWNQRVGKADA